MTGIVVLLFFGVSTHSEIPPDFSEQEKITGLDWKYGPIQLLRDVSVGTFQIQLEGYYQNEDWELYLADYKVPLKEDGEFSILIPVDINRFKIEFTARSPQGEVQSETVRVNLNGLLRTRKPTKWVEKHLRNLSMDLGLGTGFITYKQTDLDQVSQTNLTPKIDLTYVLDPGVWNVEASGYASIASFTNSPLAGTGMKLLGADLRLGYRVPLDDPSLAVFLLGGFYYMTTFGTDTIGYGGVMGPEIFPAVRKVFSNGSSAAAYVKYTPIMSDLSLLSLQNGNLTGGITYFFKPFSDGFLNGVPLGIGLEASRFRMEMRRGEIVTTSYTASAHLMF